MTVSPDAVAVIDGTSSGNCRTKGADAFQMCRGILGRYGVHVTADDLIEGQCSPGRTTAPMSEVVG